MAAEITFRILFGTLVVALMLMRAYYGQQARRAGGQVAPTHEAIAREGRAFFALRVVLFFVLLASIVLYAAGSPWLAPLAVPLPDVLRWGGFVLGVLSIAWWTWVQHVLGRQWSANLQIQQQHTLITSGPYQRIRHPLYLALFVYVFAIALVTANAVFMTMCAIVIVGMSVRIPKEEQMMLEQFGDEYRAYQQRSGRLWPPIAHRSS